MLILTYFRLTTVELLMYARKFYSVPVDSVSVKGSVKIIVHWSWGVLETEGEIDCRSFVKQYDEE